MNHTADTFRIQAYGAFRLYDVYASTSERDIYIDRVGALVGDWARATEALHDAIMHNDQVPTPEDLVKFANPRYSVTPKRRRHKLVYKDDPRQEIVYRLAENKFTEIYRDLAKTAPAGKNEMKACCPFHADKSPSFNWNTASGLWICRSGCGGGSVFDYEMAMTGESYGEVLNRLARELGIEREEEPAGSMQFNPE